MPPLTQWRKSPLVNYTSIKENVTLMRLFKKYEDPNDVGCHGWDCYTGAEKAGIIFMSIIVPLVLFLIIWILVIRPMDDISISSGMSGTEQRETRAAQETVQLPQPQMSEHLPHETQPVSREENGQAMSSPAPASQKQSEDLPPLIPGPGTASVPQSQECTVRSPLKLSTAAVPRSASPVTMNQSPTIVVNINTPQMSDTVVPIVSDSAAEAPSQKRLVTDAGQTQDQQPTEQHQTGQPLGPSSETLPEQPRLFCAHLPIPPGGQGTSRMSFPPFSSFPRYPPGYPSQTLGRPVYVAAPQFMTVIPPPPPPLAAQSNRALMGTSRLQFMRQVPRYSSRGPPTGPPDSHMRLSPRFSQPSKSQPSSPITRKTSCGTAEQSNISQSCKHPLMGRARTMSDLRSDYNSFIHLRQMDAPGMILPSETTSREDNNRGEDDRKVALGRKHAHARRSAERHKKLGYQHNFGDTRKQISKSITARRQRPTRRASSRSRSPYVRRYVHAILLA